MTERALRLTCRQIIHLHGVSYDGAASISWRSVPVQEDGVSHAAPRCLVALEVGEADHGFAGLARHIVQRTVAILANLTAASSPGRTVAIFQVGASGQRLELFLFLGGRVAHDGRRGERISLSLSHHLQSVITHNKHQLSRAALRESTWSIGIVHILKYLHLAEGQHMQLSPLTSRAKFLLSSLHRNKVKTTCEAGDFRQRAQTICHDGQ